jgi:hypothetical protein
MTPTPHFPQIQWDILKLMAESPGASTETILHQLVALGKAKPSLYIDAIVQSLNHPPKKHKFSVKIIPYPPEPDFSQGWPPLMQNVNSLGPNFDHSKRWDCHRA